MRTKSTAESSQPPANSPREPEIAARAYELYLERGCTDGHDLEDWFEAERDLIDQDATMMA
jgi:hypothetical protein